MDGYASLYVFSLSTHSQTIRLIDVCCRMEDVVLMRCASDFADMFRLLLEVSRKRISFRRDTDPIFLAPHSTLDRFLCSLFSISSSLFLGLTRYSCCILSFSFVANIILVPHFFSSSLLPTSFNFLNALPLALYSIPFPRSVCAF